MDSVKYEIDVHIRIYSDAAKVESDCWSIDFKNEGDLANPGTGQNVEVSRHQGDPFTLLPGESKSFNTDKPWEYTGDFQIAFTGPGVKRLAVTREYIKEVPS